MKQLALAVTALSLFACAPGSPGLAPPAPGALPAAPPPPPAARPPGPDCTPGSGGVRPTPIDASGVGASVALARFDGRGEARGRTIAFVADEQEAALRTVDVDARAEIARTPLAGAPAQVLVLADGRLVVSLRDRAALEVLEVVDPGAPSAPLSRRCLVEVAAEPIGLATTPDGLTLLVASRWGHALSAYAARDLSRLGAADLPRDPGAVAASIDGRLAFVSHVVGGRVSVVDLAAAGMLAGAPAPSGEGPPAAPPVRELLLGGVEWRPRGSMFFEMSTSPPLDPPVLSRQSAGPGRPRARPASRIERDGAQGFALARAASGVVFAPEALVDTRPGDTGGYGGSSTGTVIGSIAVIDARGERAVVPQVSSTLGIRDCLLPRAAALDPKDDVLLVSCLGLDAVVAYDASPPRPGARAAASGPHDRELFRVAVGAGPTGVAVDAEARRAVVFSQFAGALTVVPLGRKLAAATRAAETASIPLPPGRALDPEVSRGRALFHAASGRRIAFDGRACASCHPDGRDDGLTWVTPEGPRQTPMLLGRLEGTAPYGWQGDKAELSAHFARTINRLGGTGLDAGERDALFAYIASLAPPRAPAPSDRAAPEIARGAELFHADETGCAACHLGDELTTDGILHDVKSATPIDALHQGGAFETPSLRFIARSAPYFHDGRYPTLSALLRGTDGTMGRTGRLSDADRDALVVYLESL